MSIGTGIYGLGFFIFLSILVYIDYQEYLRSGKSICFEDKTESEIKMREIQKDQINKKYKEIENELR